MENQDTDATSTGIQVDHWWQTAIPITKWLPGYKVSNLQWDLVAGITLAFFVMPESLAYATLAGLQPQVGIYCCLTGGLFFAIFTSSKHVAVGPTSAISLMIGSSMAVLSGGDLSRWLAIAELTALVVAAICIVAFLLRLSALVNFISESILLGFKAGAALSIASTQLPKLFGVEGGGENFFGRIQILISHLPETNQTVLIFGLVTLALLIVGNRLFHGKPISLLIVIASILVITCSNLSSSGIHLTGNIASGLPPIGTPSLSMNDVDGVLELAFACFLMGYIETVSAARTFAQKNNYEVSPRQELLSLGIANFASAFTSGYVVSGGLSQSTVNEKAGARTPLALIICSAVLAVLLFFTGVLRNLPEVVLAAIVIDAVLGLIKIKELKRIYRLSWQEFAVGMIALVAVLLLGILKGVVLASIMSVIFLLRRIAFPNVAQLGKIPGTDRYTDIARHPDNEVINGVLILRVEASILYFNSEAIKQQLISHIERSTDAVQLVVIDLSASSYIDVSGAKMLLQVSTFLKERNIRMKIVEALASVRDMLRKLGMEEIVGHISRKDSINEVVAEFLAEKKSDSFAR